METNMNAICNNVSLLAINSVYLTSMIGGYKGDMQESNIKLEQT